MTESGPETVSSGSIADITARMRAVMPGAWFPIAASGTAASATPVLDGLLAGISSGWSYCYALAVFVRQQTRLGTATGSFLDMICVDYFGSSIRRKAFEIDDTFRNRIIANLLIPHATRQALIKSLGSFLSFTPYVFEPRRAVDTGGYGGGSSSNAGGGGGYNTAATILGSMSMPYQYMITVVGGYGRSCRESEATFVDADGQIQVAPRRVMRPLYVNGVASGTLTETRSFNLIKDSVGWSNLSQSEPDLLTRWTVDFSGSRAIWGNHAVLQITVYSGGIISGPVMTACAPEGPVTASLWLLLPVDHRLQSLTLVAGQVLNQSEFKSIPIDLTITEKWQRLSVTLTLGHEQGGRVYMQLSGVAEALMNTPILTQCWQMESGSTASSYIPSYNQIGIREADDAHEVTDAHVSPIDISGLAEVIDRVIPVGSIAWTTVLD